MSKTARVVWYSGLLFMLVMTIFLRDVCVGWFDQTLVEEFGITEYTKEILGNGK